MTRAYDDLDSPNTAPGDCPECGQPANIWCAVASVWQCSFCNWAGRHPRVKPVQPGTLPP